MSKNDDQARPTIGVLIDWLGTPYHDEVLTAVNDAVKKHQTNLICFVGGALDVEWNFIGQGNVIYRLANEQVVDGVLMWASTLGHYVDAATFKDFYQSTVMKPLVSLGEALDDIPSILTDNDRGLRELMVYLIEGHGYREIAFIGGPDNNPEAQARFHVYRQVLEEYDIDFDPDLVAPGQFLLVSGTEAIQILLDDRKVSFEAIVAANDDMAFGAIQALQARGIRVPDDVAVVGYDDQADSRYGIPPLTTVRQPVDEQCDIGLQTLLAMLKGEEAASVTILPTKLVVRQSCGMVSETARDIGRVGLPDDYLGDITQVNFQTDFIDIWNALLDEICKIRHRKQAPNSNIIRDQSEKLLTALLLDARTSNSRGFLAELSQQIRRDVAEGLDVQLWHQILTIIRRTLLPFLPEPSIAYQLESLWQQGRVIIGEMAEIAEAQLRLATERQSVLLGEITWKLISTFNVSQLMDILATDLPRLDIDCCYLALYEDVLAGTPVAANRQTELPHYARLILAFDKAGRQTLPEKGERFETSTLLPPHHLARHSEFRLLALPLYFRREHLGFVLFPLSLSRSSVYETLRLHISSALQGALLVGQIQANALHLEDLVEERTVALQNAYQSLKRFNTRMQEDLVMAHHIQQSLLPPVRPAWSGLDIVCSSTPAREVGGDFYAYHANRLDHSGPDQDQTLDHYVIAVGDVSGKGMPAALLMSLSLAAFQTLVRHPLAPDQLLQRLDASLTAAMRSTKQNCALACVYVSEQEDNITFRAVNAGCMTPILRHHDDTVEWLETGGFPLGFGLGQMTEYPEAVGVLRPNDMLILTSDGLVEAKNRHGEILGFSRLTHIVETGPTGDAQALMDHIEHHMAEFVGNTAQHDDVTVVIITPRL
ncbi:MAG: SpoIIE family protein phosphatase [Chloroflexota bacterium]